MANIPIFIINLEKSVERKEFIKTQFEKFDSLPYQFFNAVYGKENPNYPLFKKYNEDKRLKYKGNIMSLSQLGCWASHYHLWEKSIELNKPIIILEDDAIIHSYFAEAYQFICSDKNIFDFLWLSPPSPRNRNQKGKCILGIQNSAFKIERFYKGWGNATGYFITPKAAETLLNFTQEWIYNVDITMDRYWEHKLDYLAITPACIEPDLTKESNISMIDVDKKRELVLKIRREIYQLKDTINKFFYNLNR